MEICLKRQTSICKVVCLIQTVLCSRMNWDILISICSKLFPFGNHVTLFASSFFYVRNIQVELFYQKIYGLPCYILKSVYTVYVGHGTLYAKHSKINLNILKICKSLRDCQEVDPSFHWTHKCHPTVDRRRELRPLWTIR